jgi:spore coat protein CotH
MIIKRILIFVFVVFFQINSFSQSDFYDVDTVREIRVYFHQSDWDALLDSFYVLGDNDRVLADIIIDGSSYDSVGIRYKGFSSASVNRVKNPFNIKLDYIIDGQDHQGIDKLKLSNVIQDPSFIREVLSYEISRKYLPSSQANFTNLYINDTLWGLYTNVESVNKSFLINHFDSKYNAFVKCNPENLNVQISAENSNLSNTHGTDSTNYEPYYSMKSDYGWTDLYNLIDTLNNFPDSIEQVLNVDRALWMHAINYSLVNFDSYIGYGQNYYLYKDRTKQFNPILWDFNMSFGGFRLTDASQLYFNGFDIFQAQEMDPLIHHNFISVAPRPLMTNLFSDERNRKMYLAHIRTIMQENFINQDYYLRGQYFQNLIDTHVQNDTNKFYLYSDFTTNLTNQVSLVASVCPGITQLMDARSNYLSSYSGYSGEPSISNISTSQNISLGDNLWITAEVFDATYARVSYRFGENQRFKNQQMFDDGTHNDGLAGDGVYGCKISNCSNAIDYYFYADNDSSGVFSPVKAAYEYYSYQFGVSSGDLVINEVMSNNVSTVTDNSGKFEDWIELYNTTNFPISTNGLFITDTITNLHKWNLPNHIILPNSYFIIWADEDGSQGAEHANFKLSNFGERLILSNSDSSIIDSITYLTQLEDVSFARIPNGTGPFTMMTPTFNNNNNTTKSEEISISSFTCYPNPFSDKLNVISEEGFFVMDIFGRIILESNHSEKTINTSSWNTGLYFIHLKDDSNKTFKLIKIK